MYSLNKNRKWIFLTLSLLVLGYLILWQHFPGQIQAVYFNRFYIYYSALLRLIFGFIPFSVGDVLYIVAGCWLIFKSYKVTLLILRKQFNMAHLKKILLRVTAITITFLIIFKISWGLNYYRVKIIEQLHAKNAGYSATELVTLVDSLIKQTNRQHYLLTGNDTVATPVKWDSKTGYDKAYTAYSYLTTNRLSIKCPNKSIKSSLFTPLINYSGVSGYYNPFTGEAQINTAIPDISLPFTVCHEMAHQTGYAAEDEANFIAYLVCEANPDLTFQYSGSLSALLYALRELQLLNHEVFQEHYKTLATGVRKDIRIIHDYWKNINETLSYVLDIYYNDYLKLNNQHSGIKSYNEMTALLIAYRKL